MTLPRNPLHWPDEERHELAERIGMRIQDEPRPVTPALEREVAEWAERLVRERHRRRVGVPS